MQTAGAIPKGKAFKTMTEDAARDSITRWYTAAVTKKLQAEKSEQSPEIRAQKKLSRRLGKESEKKKPTNPDATEEGATAEKQDSLADSSEDEAEKLVAEESGKKAIQKISEDLISRVRMMRAKLTPGGGDSDNESSEGKEQRLMKEGQEN